MRGPTFARAVRQSGGRPRSVAKAVRVSLRRKAMIAHLRSPENENVFSGQNRQDFQLNCNLPGRTLASGTHPRR